METERGTDTDSDADLSRGPSAAAPVVDVLVQGQASVDLTFLGLTELPKLGEEYYASGFSMNPGACFITVAALSRMGVRAGFATEIGSDIFSAYILGRMREAAIDDRFVRICAERDLIEVSVGISFPQDRSFITWNGARGSTGRQITIADLRQNTVRCIFTHLPLEEPVAAEAHRQSIPICVDTFWDLAYLQSATIWTAIKQATVFLPNAKEAALLTGKELPEEALAVLAELVPMVVISLGPDGAIGMTGGKLYRVRALPVPVVDVTGAGDNLDAGFMYGLVNGMTFEQCLRCAVVAGSLSTTFPGGIDGSPTRDELEAGLRWLERLASAETHCFEAAHPLEPEEEGQ